MKRIATLSLLATMAAMPAFAQVRQQSDNAFSWSGKIPPGRWIRVQNLNGVITVAAATGDNVEVTATKRWRRGDPEVVRFETKKFGPNDESVFICALWGERATCDENGYRSNGSGNRERGMRNNDVVVEFRVLIPRGVRVGVATVNGDVIVDGATADVEAGTVNGEVDITGGTGRVSGSNVNGNVRARLSRVENDGQLEFKTVNGSVTVDLPSDTGADIELQTVNGSLNTNFDMTLSGRFDPRRIRTHVGRPGGPRIRIETVNGSIDLKRR
jgi:hypothetical protein